tara:strand:- start:465 stop:698 length:234 start_codon:yes stop_codon:yes gene_type:complete
MKRFKDFKLTETAPTNALAGGQIAGTVEAGDKPPVRNRAFNRYKKKNEEEVPEPMSDPLMGMYKRKMASFKSFWGGK